MSIDTCTCSPSVGCYPEEILILRGLIKEKGILPVMIEVRDVCLEIAQENSCNGTMDRFKLTVGVVSRINALISELY